MVLFDKGYNYLVSRYIAPLVDYRIPYSKLRQHHIKLLLAEKTINVVQEKTSDYSFYFQKDDLLSAQVGDYNLFYIRALLQRDSVVRINNISGFSADWALVTDYYYSFFLANLLLRLCHRGVLHFDSNNLKRINQIISAMCAGPGIVGDLFSYQINLNETDAEFSVYLASMPSKNSHQLVWDEVARLIKEFTSCAQKDSDEYVVLMMIQEINQSLGANFPSKLRNQINYQPHYGIRTVNKDFYAPNMFSEKWLSSILEYHGKTDDEQVLINIFAAYTRYIQSLTFNLASEDDQLCKRGSGLLHSINKGRSERIIVPQVQYTYP